MASANGRSRSGSRKEPGFGAVVNETMRRSIGHTTDGHKIPENNRKVNDWMRDQMERGSNTKARAEDARDSLRGGKD